MSSDRVRLADEDLHDHLCSRMAQRGISLGELEQTLNEGWDASNAKPGTSGRVLVFEYGQEWQGTVYPEKEVTVYYKPSDIGVVILTAVARYGSGFARG